MSDDHKRPPEVEFATEDLAVEAEVTLDRFVADLGRVSVEIFSNSYRVKTSLGPAYVGVAVRTAGGDGEKVVGQIRLDALAAKLAEALRDVGVLDKG